MMRHLLHKEHRAVAWPQYHLFNHLSGVGRHIGHHLTGAGVGRTGDAQIMAVERLVEHAGVAALGKGVHQGGRDIAWPRPDVDAFDGVIHWVITYRLGSVVWHEAIVLDW